ncbi:MAG: 6-carboxytetrahydropterin synthase, partial [Thermoguttaceae bacterium]|nr:6-carboxytetrahydropterin synthase [Thermoguttaceae bacterium]
MFFVSREFSFCYGHRLLGHPGKCRHPHGHNGRAVITLSMPELNANGMVVDFTDLKGTVGRWIDE